MRLTVLPLLLAFLARNPVACAQTQATPAESLAHPPAPGWQVAQPGQTAFYAAEQAAGLRATQVKFFTMGWTAANSPAGHASTWLFLRATKADGTTFQAWLETPAYPAETPTLTLEQARRYLIQQGETTPIEFRHAATGQPVLPSLGGWIHAWPRGLDTAGNAGSSSHFPARVRYLGHAFRLAGPDPDPPTAAPTETRLLRLRPDALVGVPSNTRTRGTARRYDGSDDERVRLNRADFLEMVDAGMNCLRVDAAQLPLIQDLPVFYWGVSAADVAFPECLYDSRYLGPTLFLDEPAVHTRDHVLRPRLAREPSFRREITPRLAFDAFRELFQHAVSAGAADLFQQGLAARADVDPGTMRIRQANVYSWETMISTAGWQLSQDPVVPAALVFEPPGRVGTRRTLPELNMAYGCQIPATDPSHFIDIISGFLRGAARLTGKQWGTSIYGAVDRADAPWFLTRAYDLGATHFFFWDNAGLACVPYAECLALARQLKMRMENQPPRDLERLRQAAEVLILVPVGYNLGHVHLGKGSLWGLTELNLERTNTHGLRYRQVMGHVFTEIERCLRLGVGFDLLWDQPGPPPTGYREVVRIREDGQLDLWSDGRIQVLAQPRTPERPAGRPPALTVTVSTRTGPAPLRITARAQVTETEAPVYYTLGTDPRGICHNAAVAWELFGPEAEDYRPLTPAGLQPRVEHQGRQHEATLAFSLDRPGTYRLRAATADLAGRTAVEWTTLEVTPPAPRPPPAPLPAADGYRGIWYFNQPSRDEYRYKYSGGMATYPQQHIPIAVYCEAARKTFFVYGGTTARQPTDKQELLHMISFFDHRTGTVPRPRILLHKQTSDAHDNPVLSVDDTGHLWVFSPSHGTGRPSFIHRSTQPYSIEAFERILQTNFSYPQPWWQPGRGFVFLHTRYGQAGVGTGGVRRLHVWTSADGRHWDPPQPLADIELGDYQVSWSEGDRVGTAFDYHPKPVGLNARANVYYAETRDGGQTWQSVTGEPLTTPITQVRNPALVYDSRAEGLLVYLKDLAFDRAGRPVILCLTSKGYESGPGNGPRTWQVLRWTGAAWERHPITTSLSNYDHGSLYLDPDDAWRLVAPTEPGPQPYNPGGEMAMWLSGDEGKTWKRVRQLTQGSTRNHTYARRPVHAHPGFYAFWADGHAREPSASNLYFTDQTGSRVWRLPTVMTNDVATPELAW